LLKLETDKKA